MIDVGQIAPGESLEVRGGNIGTDLVVRVELAANGRVIPLGEAVCDGHGDFAQTFVLPADLASGVYTLQVVDPSSPGPEVVMASTQLSVRTTGWTRLIGIGALIAFSVVALITAGFVLLKRRRHEDRVPKPRNAPARREAR